MEEGTREQFTFATLPPRHIAPVGRLAFVGGRARPCGAAGVLAAFTALIRKIGCKVPRVVATIGEQGVSGGEAGHRTEGEFRWGTAKATLSPRVAGSKG